MGEDIAALKIKFASNVNKVAELNRDRVVEQHIPPDGIKTCVEPELLASIFSLGASPGVTSANEREDARVRD